MQDHSNPIMIDPGQFYELVDLAESFDETTIAETALFLDEACFLIDEQVRAGEFDLRIDLLARQDEGAHLHVCHA